MSNSNKIVLDDGDTYSKNHKNDMSNSKHDNNIDEHHKENKLVTILKDIANPIEHCLVFEKEIIQSTLGNPIHDQQVSNVVEAFNQGRPSIMVSSVFGKRINPDEYRVVVKNNVPELVPPSENQVRKGIYADPSTKTHNLCTSKQTDIFIGGYGSFVVNVPPGKIALAWRGIIPILLGPGPHVIHDANLKEIKASDLIDMNSEYITHGTYHIIRVYPGNCQKIWIGATPYILTPKNTPYIFNQPVFSKTPESTKLSTGYISHGNYNIIQVPRGKVAKVWINSTKPMLLEESDDPYLFTDPSFVFNAKSATEHFHDASERIIVHGSIKRIMPRTGEVAITYNNGNLETFGPNQRNEPTIITSVNHNFDRFLTINIQTIEFPSEKAVGKRIKENKTSKNDIDYPDVNYEVFRTSDGLPIGVKLLVVFEIDNPALTLSRLNPDNIMSHIENLVVADMGLVVQQCSSTDFLKSNQPSVREPTCELLIDFYENLQQKVFNTLKRDFNDYGIKLSRLNIETPKILDTTISSKMAEFSLMNTEAGAKIAVMDKNFNIGKRQAEQDANTKQIRQQQENDQKIAQAKAEMESAKMRAEARIIEAEAEAKAIIIKAEADAEAKKLFIKVMEEQSAIYDKSPGFLQYQMAEVQATNMKGISSMIVSPEVAMSLNFLPNLLQQNRIVNK